MIQKIELTTRKGKKVTGRRVAVTSDFPSHIENIWTKIQDVDTLREICRPKARFVACGDAPVQWKEGETFVFKMYVHCFFPLGRHTIHVVKMDRASHEIDTQEYNAAVPVWNHYIKMEELGPHATRYADTVDLYAGCLTPAVAWWTLRFYRHRQRKWQKIAKGL